MERNKALAIAFWPEKGRWEYGFLPSSLRKRNLGKENEMAAKCGLLDECGFLKKHQPIEDMACRYFIQEYCRGTRMAECKRREHFRQHGMQPSDDMMPTGKNLTEQRNS